jgi:hypothetical protein
MQTQQTSPPAVQMFQMITGFWTSCCIYVAAQLNIADLLAKNPKTASQLADETQTHAPSLYRLIRTLSSFGVFYENEKNEFELTPLGCTLRTGVPGSLKYHAIMNLHYHYNAWGNLLQAVKTGEIAFDNLHKMSVWEYYEKDKEGIENFNKAMNGVTQMVVPAVVAAYDFSAFETIVDVGGGDGTLLCGILKNNEKSKGIVFDLLHAKQQALMNIELNKLQERCLFREGSFFENVPCGASAYIMKSVLHDWDDEHSKKILSKLFEAMPRGGKLLMIEYVIPERNVPHPAKLMDINMLVMTGGRGRTAKEWQELIEETGLKFLKIIPTQSPMFPIIETEKI